MCELDGTAQSDEPGGPVSHQSGVLERPNPTERLPMGRTSPPWPGEGAMAVYGQRRRRRRVDSAGRSESGRSGRAVAHERRLVGNV